MPKQGILHDYDLMANQENSSRGVTCDICGTENTTFQWSDYSGEGMCIKCGCPYQLKWGSEEQQKENKYPYLNVRPILLPMMKEYWEKNKEFVCYGMMFGNAPGINEFCDWMEKEHPKTWKELTKP